MKIVSYEVAKAIKEAGYPQDNVKYIHKVKSFPMYYNGDYVPDYEYFYLNYISDFDFQLCVAAPTYVEVWFWLWRTKKISINIDHLHGIFWGANTYGEYVKNGDGKPEHNDPEDAIMDAVNYLVDNKLLK